MQGFSEGQCAVHAGTWARFRRMQRLIQPPRHTTPPPSLPALQFNFWHLDAVPEDPKVTLLANDTVRLHPLPVILFSSGHVAFVQRTPWR